MQINIRRIRNIVKAIFFQYEICNHIPTLGINLQYYEIQRPYE